MKNTPKIPPPPGDALEAAPVPPAPVALVPCLSYEDIEVDRALAQALELLGGWEPLFPPGAPFISSPTWPALSPRSGPSPPTPGGESRSPQAHGRRPPSDRGGQPRRPGPPRLPEIPLPPHRHGGLGQRTGPASRPGSRPTEVKLSHARSLRVVTLNRSLAGAPALLNLPKFKTHLFARLTGATKNLYGGSPA